MDHSRTAERDGVTAFGDFEGASLTSIAAPETDSFIVECLEEPDLPPNGFRVFYDYSFSCGLRNTTGAPRTVQVRFNLCPRSGKRNVHFMRGPHWVREAGSWRLLPPSAHTSGEDWVTTRINLSPGSEVIVSTKPFWTAEETESVLAEYVERLSFVSYRSLGKTAEDRDIWAIETEDRPEKILVSSSLQSAEFAGFVILFWLDWLGMRDSQTQALLDRFQFILIPETMADGVAHGYSIRNAVGECPMFHFPEAFAGEPAPAETTALTKLLKAKRPAMWMDLHIHPGDYATPKLVWIESESYPDEASANRSLRVREAALKIAPDWRPVSYPLHHRPEFSGRHTGVYNAAVNLGTVGLVLQSYAYTEEGKKALFARIMEAALSAL
jgi:hypothetical protein